MTDKQTVAGAYAKIESHEELCVERYDRIHEILADLKYLIRWILGGIATVAVSLIAWMAIQLYTSANSSAATNSARISALEQPHPSSQTVVVQQPRGR